MLILRTLWPYALCLLIGFSAAYAWQGNRYTAELADLQSDYATASQVAVKQALDEQQRVQASTESAGAKGNEVIEVVRTEYVTIQSNDERLRQRYDAVRASARSENSRLATEWATATATIEALTGLLEELGAFAGEAAFGADDARARGLTCEAAYNGIRGTE